MVKLIITTCLTFVEGSRVMEYESYTVSDDYLNSPLLSSKYKDGLIYLESDRDEKISPYVLTLENESTFELMIFAADHYQMYNVKSFIDKMISKISEGSGFQTSIEDIFDNIPKDIISRILDIETSRFWENQVFHRGKMGEFKFIKMKIDDYQVKKFPTHPSCFYKNPLLAWKCVSDRTDIKKLLYLTAEMDLNVDENILEVATQHSNRDCYPYDDDMVKECSHNDEIYKISMSTFEGLIEPLHEKMLNNGGTIHDSFYLVDTLLHRNIEYKYENPEVSNIKNMLDKMCNKVLITYTNDENAYDIHCIVNKEYGTLSVHKYEKSDNYFNIEIFKQDGKIKINTNGKFLIYACTNLLPMTAEEYMKKEKHDNNINIGVPFHKNTNNEKFTLFKVKPENMDAKIENNICPHGSKFKWDDFNFVYMSIIYHISYMYMIYECKNCGDEGEIGKINFKGMLESDLEIFISISMKPYIVAAEKTTRELVLASGRSYKFDLIYTP